MPGDQLPDPDASRKHPIAGITTTPSVQAGGQALRGEAGSRRGLAARHGCGAVTCLTAPFVSPGLPSACRPRVRYLSQLHISRCQASEADSP